MLQGGTGAALQPPHGEPSLFPTAATPPRASSTSMMRRQPPWMLCCKRQRDATTTREKCYIPRQLSFRLLRFFAGTGINFCYYRRTFCYIHQDGAATSRRRRQRFCCNRCQVLLRPDKFFATSVQWRDWLVGVVDAIPFSEHQRRGAAAKLQPEPLRAATAGAAVAWVEAVTRRTGEGGNQRRGWPARVRIGDEEGHRRGDEAPEGSCARWQRCGDLHEREMHEEEEDLGRISFFFR